MTLARYLEHKPLYYDKIDYLRMPRAYESIKKHLKIPKIIQIIGTNGKGSTGRFLSMMLMQKNLSIGHYSSPHVFKFNERIWINGKDVSDIKLEQTHQELQSLLSDEFKQSLSYFEYTTFLAIMLFSKRCDFVVLEAGLGGEYDATSVFPKILSVVTPIGHDHESFLGKSIKDIAVTKINSINTDTLLSKQSEQVVYEIANKISCKKDVKLFLSEDVLDQKDLDGLEKIMKKNRLPSFQKTNLQTALSAANILGFDTDLQTLKISLMPGRCQKVENNITVDVGHNTMAAVAMREYFLSQKIVLIYNSFKDKEYEKILKILKPIIKRVEIIDIQNDRKMATKEIVKVCKQEDILYTNFKKIDLDEEYLVFGSFVVVEEFLKSYKER